MAYGPNMGQARLISLEMAFGQAMVRAFPVFICDRGMARLMRVWAFQ